MNRCVGLTWFWNDRRLFHPHSFQLTLIIDKNARAQQWAPAIQLQLPSPHAPQWRQNKMTDWIQNIELKVFKRERKIVLMTLWSANDTLPSLALVWSSRQLRGPFRILGNKLLFGAIGYHQQLIYMTWSILVSFAWLGVTSPVGHKFVTNNLDWDGVVKKMWNPASKIPRSSAPVTNNFQLKKENC